MNDDDLAKILARTHATTPGKWEVIIDQHQGKTRDVSIWTGGVDGKYVVEHVASEADARFIVGARDAIMHLSWELARMQGALEEARRKPAGSTITPDAIATAMRDWNGREATR